MAVANDGRHPVDDIGGNVSVLLGNGDGTFQSAVNYIAGWAPAFLAVGDFTGDGKPDLAINGMGYLDLELVGGPVEVLLNTCASAGIHLIIVRSKTTPTLSSPQPYTNFVLESTASVSSTNWHSVPGPPTTNNGQFEITVPLDQERRYFRLRKPVLGTGLFPQSVVTAGSNGDSATALAVTNGYITALLRSECTSAPSPPPPLGKLAVGPD